MPAYRHHNHGQLIISFNVEFPDTIPAESFQYLEKALPPRPELPTIPKDHHVDEVVLEDADLTRQQRARGDDDMMDEDEDGHPQGAGVSCQNQ